MSRWYNNNEERENDIYFTISCNDSGYATGIAIDENNFPDEKFRAIVDEFDTVDDDILTDEEIAAVFQN